MITFVVFYMLFCNYEYTECSERRLIAHSFYLRNFLRKSCATCRENAAVRHRLLRSLIILHNEHRVYWRRKLPPRGTTSDKPAQCTP
jgi:hypothetical protein